jgi:hypothetical protein
MIFIALSVDVPTSFSGGQNDGSLQKRLFRHHRYDPTLRYSTRIKRTCQIGSTRQAHQESLHPNFLGLTFVKDNLAVDELALRILSTSKMFTPLIDAAILITNPRCASYGSSMRFGATSSRPIPRRILYTSVTWILLAHTIPLQR